MPEHVIKLPDVGEGVAEAELVEWHVKVGDLVREDAVLAAVMTDKATVEVPSPVDGEVVWLGAEVGDTVPVGSPLIRLKVAGDGANAAAPMDDGLGEAPVADGMAPEGEDLPPPPQSFTADPSSRAASGRTGAPVASAPDVGEPAATAPPYPSRKGGARASAPRALSPPGEDVAGKRAQARSTHAASGSPRAPGDKPLASPAVRLKAREAGIDLRQVRATGPAGRITHEDLEAFAARGAEPAGVRLRKNNAVGEIKIIGLRRRIAEKMALAKSRIPHITYVEEVDVTGLEELRAALNKENRADRPKLTLLPFLIRAMVKAIAEHPKVNAHFDDEAGIVRQHGGVHVGIAAQTPAGLVVPVVRHAEARNLFGCAAEVNRLAGAAKAGTATREELSGSTITITSLGALGGVATTPVINHPEVAIVGVNKMVVRPHWDGAQFVPRKMMNLSSSFDHRVIDGWDAALFVQRIKALMETPALIFVDG